MTDERNNALFQTSHLMILISYTTFSIVLIAESVLLSWESWVYPLIVAGVLLSWGLHITQSITESQRIWVYSLLMMATFFFYGCHETSMYDMAGVMAVIIILFCMTGISGLIYLSMFTYFATLGYDLIIGLMHGMETTPLMITRTLLHIAMILMAGWIARLIIKKWGQVLRRADDKIEELTDATRRVDDFLANVSHEIRTPINAVIGLSTVLTEREMRPDVRTDLMAIGDAGRRVAEQIGDILDYTEIDTKKLAVTRETYMVNSLVNDLAVQIRMLMRPEVELIFDVNPQTPVALIGDVVKIRKILWHLIANGLKYTRQGGVYARIYAAPREYGVNLCIEVTDTGIGMRPDIVDKCYERFYQGDSGRQRAIGGLGLGIPIVNGFAEAMGGFLKIDSEPGKGTRTIVSIPQTIAEAEPCMSVINKEKLMPVTYFRFEQFTIPQIREFYQNMIEHIGRGMKFAIHRVNELSELKKLVDQERISHLFIGVGEYRSDPEYMEALAESIRVTIVADETFHLPAGSLIHIMRKPANSFLIANILNSEISEEDTDGRSIQHFTCPGLKTLVVDDERMNLMVAEGVFKNYGMEVTTVLSGYEAIEICKKEHFDLIFMDHMMPEMDGVEAMKRIRADAGKRDREIIIIALTANAVSSAREMFLSEGFNGFVPKPIDIAELERVLKRELPKSAIHYGKPVFRGGDGSPRSSEEEITALSAVGIRTSAGLSYCMNDTEFYRSLLLEFGATAEAKIREIDTCYGQQDWKNYRIRVHALKSNARMIGAEQLSDLAREVENASAEGSTQGISPEEEEQLLTMYRTAADAVCRMYGIKAESPKEDEEDILEFMPEEDGEVES
ncbi:MAG: response regulator [Lachnospiraceae bacterium]|nr:response regulator [Lachnospiraceae bacterium]